MHCSFLKYSTFIFILLVIPTNSIFPIVINTWNFENANSAAWASLRQEQSALDAIVRGCTKCEEEQCDGTVGYGGSPDENGETILDAMIMDGETMNVGSVVSMRRIKNAIGVARAVMEHTAHSILSGERATDFAIQMGFKEESLSTDISQCIWRDWKMNNCQPNFWMNVYPDSKVSCGPYSPMKEVQNKDMYRVNYNIDDKNHDTIGMISIDSKGKLAAGTSTNGATHKIPGRVADSGIPGSGCYAEQGVGAAAATGDGDIMMRFSPSFLAVDEMRRGSTPMQAAQTAIGRIAERYPTFSGALIAMDHTGNYGAACYGMNQFPFCVADSKSDGVRLEHVECKTLQELKQDKYESNDV